MRRRVAIYGAGEEALQLVPLLEENPQIEIALVYDPRAPELRERLANLPPELAATLEAKLTDDPERLRQVPLDAVVDAGAEPPLVERFGDLVERGVSVVTPLTARLLWGYGASSRDRKAELLQALHEVVESVQLTVDPDELFARMLEIAISVTGAEGGSLMLLDPSGEELRVRVAVGIEPELWPKIRVRLGEGIAGRVAAEARPLRLRGRADREAFRIVRERADVESALCVPLVDRGRVLGVLNLHHSSRPDVFTDADLEFAEQLGRLDAQIIARAQEHEALRSQAERYHAVQEVRRILRGRAPLADRLGALCRRVAEWAGDGIAHLYLYDPAERGLHLVGTSLAGGGLGAEYRVDLGCGLDGRAARERRALFLQGGAGLAYAALPLVAGEELVGVLAIQAGPGWSGRRAGRETLLEVAAAAADEIAQAERESRTAARATQVSAINEAGLRMLSTAELGEVVRLAASSAAMILEADHAVVRLQDEATRRYVIRAYFGSADGRFQERLFRLDKQVSVDAIKRRVPLHVTDVAAHERYREAETGIRSLMAAPLRGDARVIGTLAVYEKVASDRFYPGIFSEEDFQVFTRLVSYVERAIENARFHARTRRHRSFDEETGLPTAAYLGKRIDEELARAAGRAHAFALLGCRVENLDAIRATADPGHAERVLFRVADAIRARLRDFDVLARTGLAEFVALLPDPAEPPEESLASLARAIADEIAKDATANRPLRLALAFGYALYPEDGSDRAALLARVSRPRIRTL